MLVSFSSIVSAALVVNFTGTPKIGEVPLNVTFTDTSSGSPTGWAWYFGDETYTESWKLVNASAGWPARQEFSSVVLPDGSIVLMGGISYFGGYTNDVWRSTDNGSTWIEMTSNAEWLPRQGHSSVALTDGSIILMGGRDGDWTNDTWRSIDNGTTWMLVNASSGWSGRAYHTSVAMPDGSIVLMGGESMLGNLMNDVWRSTDNGSTWKQINSSSGWSKRGSFCSVAMPDGSIVLMGGSIPTPPHKTNDVWLSTDKGAIWTQMTANAGWSVRNGQTCLAMPDGSIVLMGGISINTVPAAIKNDTWRSIDNGKTWMEVNASSGWSARARHTSVAMPDGNIVLMGGSDWKNNFYNNINDVWRFMPAGSSSKSPSHLYTTPGTYQVALQVYNAGGYNSTRRAGYITIKVPPSPIASFTVSATAGTAPLAIIFTDTSTGTGITAWNWNFGDGMWENRTSNTSLIHTYSVGTWYPTLIVTNSSGSNTSPITPARTIIIVPPTPSILPVASFTVSTTTGTTPLAVTFTDSSTGMSITAWNWSFGDGMWENRTSNTSLIHTYSVGTWYPTLTVTNSSGSHTSLITPARTITVTPATLPASTKIGIYKDGAWYLDNDGSGTWNAGDRANLFGAAGWTSVLGDWNSDGKSEIGIFKDGAWYLDYNGNGFWDAGIDKLNYFGTIGWTPVVGNWNGAATGDKIGIYKDGMWYLDNDGSGTWNAGDRANLFGAVGWTPVIGNWNGAATGDKIGIYKDGAWYLDYNANGAWDNGIDKADIFGTVGYIPLVGNWNGAATGDKIGIYKDGAWYLDNDGSGTWNAGDRANMFGTLDWTPIIGNWNGDATGTKIGIYKGGTWYLDYNGNGAWDIGIDKLDYFGTLGWTPVVGKWS